MRFDRLAPLGHSTQALALVCARAVLLVAFLGLFAPALRSTDIAPLIAVSGAWIRWLPANLPAAGYVTLRNDGDRPVTLLGASTLDYGAVMFHESRDRNGTEQMLPVDSILITPHAQVTFAPHSYHIMLTQPTRVIRPGDHVLLILRFADGQSLNVHFEVRGPDGTPIKDATGSRGG